VAQENAWKCIPRSEGVAKPKDREKRARGRRRPGCDRGRDWGAEDIIRVEKPTPRTVTEKLCLILPAGPASAIVILHLAAAPRLSPSRWSVPGSSRDPLASVQLGKGHRGAPGVEIIDVVKIGCMCLCFERGFPAELRHGADI
jgi:hypothetical protein